MGKESSEATKLLPAQRRGSQFPIRNWLREEELRAELSRLWTSSAGVTSPAETRENGAVHVTIQRGGETYAVQCAGFANTGNSCQTLLQRLLNVGLLQPGLCIDSFFIRRSSMWFHFDVRASSFASGDSLLLVLSSLPPQRHPRPHKPGAKTKVEIKKSIAKATSL